MIGAGIAQGFAFLPYALDIGLTELDQALRRAKAVSLNEAYRAAFGVSIRDRRVQQKTGNVRGRDPIAGPDGPGALLEANRGFHRLLISQGMSHETARKYLVVADSTHAATRRQVLLAVVLRHTRAGPFRARDKQTNGVGTLRPGQRGWYDAYDRDADGQPIDEVMDWAAIEYGLLRHDKVVATLLVLAAEAVKFDRRAPDYWHAERRWLAGDTTALLQESADKVRRALAS